MLFFRGRNEEVLVQKTVFQGIRRMEDSFAGRQNIRGIIRTACHQSWEEDEEQRSQEEIRSEADTKCFEARKRGSARTRSLSGQIGSYGIEKRDKQNYWENNKCQLLQGVLETEGDKRQCKCNRKKKKKSTRKLCCIGIKRLCKLRSANTGMHITAAFLLPSLRYHNFLGGDFYTANKQCSESSSLHFDYTTFQRDDPPGLVQLQTKKIQTR